jgi:2-polyprenyl-3-methyl-5-hydroxy-6-metoxy-1,4-benzoquinol methylase
MSPVWPDEIGAVLQMANALENKLQQIKASHPEVVWYPYDTLGSFERLDSFLTGRRRYLRDLLGDGPVLDAGCGDGAISYALESLGCKVRAMDYPVTNHNGMKGIRTLKQELGSSIEICEANLDAEYRLAGDERYTAVFLLGVLYHLKNPFYVLEMLARHSSYCFMSTRVARYTADKAVKIANYPVAWLLKHKELNDDSTNFWILSEACLRELCARTGWEICDYTSFGDKVGSDPVTLEADERAFCLLKSKVINTIQPTAKLLSGWHDIEPGGWRWTEKRFSVAFRNAAQGVGGRLKMTFWLHEAIVGEQGPVTLTGKAGNFALPPATYGKPGLCTYETAIPGAELNEDAVTVNLSVDKGRERGGAGDARELGLAVVSLELL